MADRFEEGMATRRAVLGDAHVDRAEAAKTPLDEPFQTLITESAWGSVWSRSGLTRRDRSLITLALLAGTGNFEEIAMHVRATARTGATAEEIIEAMLHVAVYAGVPKANHAIRIVKATLAEMAADPVAPDGEGEPAATLPRFDPEGGPAHDPVPPAPPSRPRRFIPTRRRS